MRTFTTITALLMSAGLAVIAHAAAVTTSAVITLNQVFNPPTEEVEIYYTGGSVESGKTGTLPAVTINPITKNTDGSLPATSNEAIVPFSVNGVNISSNANLTMTVTANAVKAISGTTYPALSHTDPAGLLPYEIFYKPCTGTAQKINGKNAWASSNNATLPITHAQYNNCTTGGELIIGTPAVPIADAPPNDPAGGSYTYTGTITVAIATAG
jgi:hypothetical protein